MEPVSFIIFMILYGLFKLVMLGAPFFLLLLAYGFLISACDR